MEKQKVIKKSHTFEPISSKPADWALARFAKKRNHHIQQVSKMVTAKIIGEENSLGLTESLAKTLYLEKIRIREDPWKVDPKDDMEFWNRVKGQLIRQPGGNGEQAQQHILEQRLLSDISLRYTQEIAGSFNHTTYKLATRLLPLGFSSLLNAASAGNFKALWSHQLQLRETIRMTGELDHIRNLAKHGTVVLVPTHQSNLDSIVIGWALYALGLPPFHYGGGLNLFNYPIFGWFMNRLGTYKVDRRKKNPIYLETLKTYSTYALRHGAHSLFFPGGGRVRSGSLESRLKLGLLGTALEAQRLNFLESSPDFNQGTDFSNRKKIFIVPMVFSYHFVLEASSLIHSHLTRTGREQYISVHDEFSSFAKTFKFLWKLFSVKSQITLSFGRGFDLFGNTLDDEGRSLDSHGREVDTRKYFVSFGKYLNDTQRERQYSSHLGDVILQSYKKNNVVLSSHLVAFTAFEMLKKRFQGIDLYSILRLPPEEATLSFVEFASAAHRIREEIQNLASRSKIKMAPHLSGDIQEVIDHGIHHLGSFHSKRPLSRKFTGEIISEDLRLLFYYHNRLENYGLHKYI